MAGGAHLKDWLKSVRGLHRIDKRPPTATSAPTAGGLEMQDAAPAGQAEYQQSQYLDAFIKLLPGEAVAFYITFQGFAEATDHPKVAQGILAWFGLAAIFMIRVVTTMDPESDRPGKTIRWLQVLLATIAYVIWIYALGDQLWPHAEIPDQRFYGQLAVGFVAVVSPVVVRFVTARKATPGGSR